MSCGQNIENMEVKPVVALPPCTASALKLRRRPMFLHTVLRHRTPIIGDKDHSFECLQKACEGGSIYMSWERSTPNSILSVPTPASPPG
jgi:hypothetical protein